MDEFKRKFELEKNLAFRQIFASRRSELEKLTESFQWITAKIIEQGEAEVELLRAMGDQEGVVKEQIKISTIRYAQGIFSHCAALSAKKKEVME
jgi:hypothetical protein